jgi:hypothetical protein
MFTNKKKKRVIIQNQTQDLQGQLAPPEIRTKYSKCEPDTRT